MQSPSSPALSCSVPKEDPENPSPSTPQHLYATRLWRPAAQRNTRNQWSKLLFHKKEWDSASSKGRSHASSIINSHLSQRFMPSMNLGVVSEMPEIRRKACAKLARQQDLHSDRLLSSYKALVHAVSHMFSASRSMRCYQKGSADSSLIQFCSHPGHVDDIGDGGGIPVFSLFSILFFAKKNHITSHSCSQVLRIVRSSEAGSQSKNQQHTSRDSSFAENLVKEIVQMFVSELCLKRLLVIELLSLTCEEAVEVQTEGLNWSHELYPGEFDDLSRIELLSEESSEPVPPKLEGLDVFNPEIVRSNHLPQQDVLQVYLTAWLAEMNVYTNRVDQIFEQVGEEMQVSFS